MDSKLFPGVFLSLFVLAISLLYLYLTWNFNFWKKLGVKGPRPVLVFGNVPCIVMRNRSMTFDLKDLYEKYKNIGDRFIGIFMTRNPNILILDPKLANTILATNFKAFRDNEAATWVNRKTEEISRRNPFLTYYGIDWKERRRELIGGLTPIKLKSLFSIVMKISEKMTEFIRTHIENSGSEIAVHSLSYKFSMEIIADFSWGIDSKCFAPKVSSSTNILRMSERMLEASFHRVGLYYLYGLFPMIRKITNDSFFSKEVDDFFISLQKEAVNLRNQSKTSRQDFLDYLIDLQKKKNISNLDMAGNSLSLLLDGYDTVGLVIYHALIFLALNQTSQTKLRQEIKECLSEDELTYDKLINLPYLDQCLSETVRLITPINIMSKICTEKTLLEVSDGKQIQINPGIVVHIPTFAYHHDKDIFPDPEKFIPERFDDGRKKQLINEGFFMPFGAGPRICPGMKLGQLECKAAIFEIIKNFQINKSKKSIFPEYIDTSGTYVGLPVDTLLEFKALE